MSNVMSNINSDWSDVHSVWKDQHSNTYYNGCIEGLDEQICIIERNNKILIEIAEKTEQKLRNI